jgi:polar amino acid transport system substrate-binding protein
MPKNFWLIFLFIFLINNLHLSALAETVLERIARTGELRSSARKDAIPFSYIDEKTGKWTGYGVDLMRLVQRRLEQQLGKPIKITFTESTVNNRFQQVEQGKIDLSCNAATITEERLEKVAFSIPYFMTGAQFLTKRENADKIDINNTLAGVAIAYIPHTTTDGIIRYIYPLANWQAVSDRTEAVAKLQRGEVKAVVSDGILLVGEIVKQGKDPRQFALLPRQPITTELYGCILPKNDPEWKKFVDTVVGSNDNRKLREQWFNLEQSSFPYTIIGEP